MKTIWYFLLYFIFLGLAAAMSPILMLLTFFSCMLAQMDLLRDFLEKVVDKKDGE